MHRSPIAALRDMARPRFARAALAPLIAVAFATGCGGAPIPPTYTQAELEQQCVRTGGWWRPDDLRGGLCERRGI